MASEVFSAREGGGGTPSTPSVEERQVEVSQQE